MWDRPCLVKQLPGQKHPDFWHKSNMKNYPERYRDTETKTLCDICCWDTTI